MTRPAALPTAVGADWIEYQITPCYHCGGYTGPAFENLQSGKVVENNLSSTTVANLNLPQVIQPICRPLRVPAGGLLTSDGNFALVSLPNKKLVEKCGSKRPVLTIKGYVPVSLGQKRAIVWQQGNARVLRGITLPRLRRFSISLPRRIFTNAPLLGDTFFTTRTLYVDTYNEATQYSAVWAAPASRLR